MEPFVHSQPGDGGHNQNGRDWNGSLEKNMFILKGQVFFSPVYYFIDEFRGNDIIYPFAVRIKLANMWKIFWKSITHIQSQGRKQNTDGEDFA